MKSFAVVIVSLLFTGLIVAQDRPLPRVVRVVGTSEVKVVPDRAMIELGVEKQNASATVAKRSADAASRAILANLRDNGIEEKDMQTTFLSLQPQFNYRKGLKISYFVAAQTISFTIRDLSRLDALLESLIQAGGNRIDSIQYEVSDLRKYRDQARDLAMKAAHEKALALAKALDQQIGKAYSIEEIPEYNYQYAGGLMSNAGYEASRAPAKTGPATAAGEKTVSASVVVCFDLN
ncbi:MAG TPA: SIMPL domain-containing protein [Candidatus Angelobacter sp.]|nr:SIMPL domain-containing protein [Candidatus Angelobacter sp.]